MKAIEPNYNAEYYQRVKDHRVAKLWNEPDVQAAIDRHTKELARMVRDHEPVEKIMKLRNSMDILYSLMDTIEGNVKHGS